MEIAVNIFRIVASVAFIVAVFIVSKYGKSKTKEYFLILEKVVAGVEQIGNLKGWTGEKKKQYAITQAKKLGVDLTEDELDFLIESFVNEMNRVKDLIVSDESLPTEK